jgi:BCD family chlorophyll transporter-like MFS transporter
MISRGNLVRLGFFQMAAGGMSVLFLGVLNRILRVELGLDLFAVSVLIGGGHYLGALVAIPFGFFSDRNPLLGYRRSIYILFGIFTTTAILALSPWMAGWLSDDPSPTKLILGFGFFLIEGVSTFIAGTAFLALIADRTTKEERGQATSLVWTMLFIGIIVTGVGTSIGLEDYSFNRFVTLFAVSAGIALLLSIIALLKQEKKQPEPHDRSRGSFASAFRMILTSRNSRWFGAFLLISMFSFFMQDVILEPFGGEVLGFSPSETTRFNAYMGVGLIISMLVGGMTLIPRLGKRRVTELGCWILVVAFIGLTASAFFNVHQGISLVIVLLGIGGGLFTVGGVALVMDMTSTQHTGLFVGAWTLVQALARGPASLVSGGLYDLFMAWGATAGQGYGTIFILEAIGLLISLYFLRRVVVVDFHQEVVSFGTLATEAMD